MEKPLSIKREDFGKGLISLINGCGLPPFVVAETLRGICAEVDRLAAQQLEADRKAWEESQKGEGNGADNAE